MPNFPPAVTVQVAVSTVPTLLLPLPLVEAQLPADIVPVEQSAGKAKPLYVAGPMTTGPGLTPVKVNLVSGAIVWLKAWPSA